MGIIGYSGLFRRWSLSRYLISMIAATGFLFLLLLDTVDFCVNEMGARNITYDVFWMYLCNPKEIAHLLPFSVYFIYLFLFILISLIFAICIKFSHVFHDGFCHLTQSVRQLNLSGNKRKRSIHVQFLVLSYLISSLFMVKYLNASHGTFWMGEPISNYLFYWSPIIKHDSHSEAIAEKDRRIKATYPSGKPFLKKNVILIISDSLRADHMGAYGYKRPTTPFLTRMVTEGRLMKVKYAFSACPETAAGVLSTLASRDYRSLSEYNFKLNEALRDNGYNAFYILSGDQTYYQRLRWFFGQDIDLVFDGNNSKKYELTDDRVLFEGLEKVPDYKGKPAFFYFHLMSSHAMGIHLAPFNKYKPCTPDLEMDSAHEQVALINKYDNGVLQADSFIKDLFAALNKKGYLQGSIVFILADHGDALGEHHHYGHDRYVYQEDIHIPMLIYDSEEKNYKNLEFASQSDVAPTILDRLNLPIPSTWEGKSLLNSSSKVFIYSQTRIAPFRFSLLYRKDKAIYHYIRGHLNEELYNLTSDPNEKINLISTANRDLINFMRNNSAKGSDSHT